MSNRAVAEEYLDVMGKDVERAMACLAPGAEFVNPAGTVPFPEGVRAMLHGFASAFPGHSHEIQRWVEQGDVVVAEGIWTGTHRGDMGMPDGSALKATGKTARVPFAEIFRFKGGKIASTHVYWDFAGFMAQLGAGRPA